MNFPIAQSLFFVDEWVMNTGDLCYIRIFINFWQETSDQNTRRPPRRRTFDDEMYDDLEVDSPHDYVLINPSSRARSRNSWNDYLRSHDEDIYEEIDMDFTTDDSASENDEPMHRQYGILSEGLIRQLFGEVKYLSKILSELMLLL